MSGIDITIGNRSIDPIELQVGVSDEIIHELGLKADKVVNAVENNIATLDTIGNPKDSGHKIGGDYIGNTCNGSGYSVPLSDGVDIETGDIMIACYVNVEDTSTINTLSVGTIIYSDECCTEACGTITAAFGDGRYIIDRETEVSVTDEEMWVNLSNNNVATELAVAAYVNSEMYIDEYVISTKDAAKEIYGRAGYEHFGDTVGIYNQDQDGGVAPPTIYGSTYEVAEGNKIFGFGNHIIGEITKVTQGSTEITVYDYATGKHLQKDVGSHGYSGYSDNVLTTESGVKNYLNDRVLPSLATISYVDNIIGNIGTILDEINGEVL